MDHEHDNVRAARRQESSMAPGPAGLKPSRGHFNARRKDLRALGYPNPAIGPKIEPISPGSSLRQ
jgi:hypothetical protein